MVRGHLTVPVYSLSKAQTCEGNGPSQHTHRKKEEEKFQHFDSTRKGGSPPAGLLRIGCQGRKMLPPLVRFYIIVLHCHFVSVLKHMVSGLIRSLHSSGPGAEGLQLLLWDGTAISPALGDWAQRQRRRLSPSRSCLFVVNQHKNASVLNWSLSGFLNNSSASGSDTRLCFSFLSFLEV